MMFPLELAAGTPTNTPILVEVRQTLSPLITRLKYFLIRVIPSSYSLSLLSVDIPSPFTSNI